MEVELEPIQLAAVLALTFLAGMEVDPAYMRRRLKASVGIGIASFAVLVERGLIDIGIGKLLMSATFVTDLCTALALSAIFVKPNISSSFACSC